MVFACIFTCCWLRSTLFDFPLTLSWHLVCCICYGVRRGMEWQVPDHWNILFGVGLFFLEHTYHYRPYRT